MDPNPEGEGRHKGKKPAIVLALDTSGSISAQDKNRFISLAQSIPQDKIELFACTFTTSVRPLDLENPRFLNGGTAFGPIHDWIMKDVLPHTKTYPKAVVVVTDGMASFYPQAMATEEQKKGWFWLHTRKYTHPFGRAALLSEFIA